MDLVQQEFRLKTALVCIAKNEENYIEEWVNYHLKLGFNNIFIYENNWRCNIKSSQVTLIPFDGLAKQIEAYNHFLKNYKDDYDWVGFLDVDEFLVLRKDKSVEKFFNRFSDSVGIGVNWMVFGDNDLQSPNSDCLSVLKRFTKRGKEINPHIKSFLNLKKIGDVVMYVHNPNTFISNQNNISFFGPHCYDCSVEFAQINHYFTKTFEEFKLKVDRGRADILNKRNYDEFHHLNLNEIEDLVAYNFLYNDNNSLLNT